ncbi:MAG: GHKL domain-containing protein [Deltaproteobacteria bacterium]|nr:GHKL domain-containing protein [Deltaproteobacteria bacterium]
MPPIPRPTHGEDREPDARRSSQGPFRYDADRASTPLARGNAHGHAYFHRLRRQLGWRLLVAYAVPLVLLFGYFYFEYRATLREGINHHLSSIADNQRNAVDLFLQARASDLRSALSSARLLPNPAALSMDAVLAELRAESVAFVDVGLFDSQGTQVAYAGPHEFLKGRSYGDEPWFQRVLSSPQGVYISDVYLGFRGEPHFIIAVTTKLPGTAWTLRASVDPKEFGAFVGRSHLVEQAEAFVVNRKGQRQTSSADPSRDRPFPLDALPRTETVVAERVLDGSIYLSAIAPLRATDWAVVVMVPEEDAYRPMTRARLVLAALLLLGVGLVVALALRSTAKLVRRLEEADTDREDLTRYLFDAAKLASVGEMAAGVAHEINNPLAIIYETAGVMKDTLDPTFNLKVDPDEFGEHLDVIEQATLRGRDITRQLLAYARKHEPVREPLDINRQIEQALAVKDTAFRVADIEVVTDLHPELPPALADANQLEQVLLNLLNNARDAIREVGRITVKTRRDEAFVQIHVEDTGCGMTPAQAARAFFPFFTTKSVGRGTGLGLSISYGIVKAQGGRIEVESEVGVGTTFIVSLPAATDASVRRAKRKRESRRHANAP